MEELKKVLYEGGYSCVIANNGVVRTFRRRGVEDLYDLLKNESGFLRGALVADKVIGQGAAALIILGGVKELYAGVISEPALELLKINGVKVDYREKALAIRNRDNSGNCPVENLCMSVNSVEAMLPLIESFIANKR